MGRVQLQVRGPSTAKCTETTEHPESASHPGGRPPLNNLKTLLPNRNRKTQRKLRPDPLITTLRLRPIMILSSNKVLAPKRPWGPNRAHYPPLALPIPTLFSILLTCKTLSLPRDKPLPWPPGLDYSKFCPFHRYAGRTIEECHTLRDVI